MVAPANIRTSGSLHSGSSSQTCTVELTVVDALGVGQSLRALVRSRNFPPGTAEIYERVAKQMIAAARAAVINGGVK